MTLFLALIQLQDARGNSNAPCCYAQQPKVPLEFGEAGHRPNQYSGLQRKKEFEDQLVYDETELEILLETF